MCEAKKEAQTKIDRLILAVERLIDTIKGASIDQANALHSPVPPAGESTTVTENQQG